ncbi:hypothetical protein AeRB84_018407 [Aphanomyces euteiches]|nr:hypothetical protein AeRB84_018407 [Aphanomyces euteiches]
MDDRLVVATMITVASAAIAAYVASTDGRDIRGTVRQRFTMQNDQFEKALSGAVNGWFVKMVRCDLNTFLNVVQRIQLVWKDVNGPLQNRLGQTSTMKRIALCMHYLSSGGTIMSVSAVFGVSHTRGVVFVNEVLRCLVHLSKSIIHSPSSVDYRASTAAAFESLAGFPDVIGAVDGTLLRIARPAEHEGWYCRKGFPAVNVQAVVDSNLRCISCSVRAGSANDQSLWNRSGYRLHLLQQLPQQYHLLGDSGYKIWRHLVTPYPEQEACDVVVKTSLQLLPFAHANSC